MAIFKITSTTTVSELKEQFLKEFGGVLRVYEGRSEASDSAKLVSLGAKEGEFECIANRTVGSFEEDFKKEFNLKVKVYTKDNWVAVLDGITLASVKDIPKSATKASMEEFVGNNTTNNKESKKVNMKKVVIELYGEGWRLEAYDEEGDMTECYNAYKAGEYFSIKIGGERYSYEDFGQPISKFYWPDDIYDEENEKFIDSVYAKYEGEEPRDVFDFEGCMLYDAEEKGIERINIVQTKVPATVEIEMENNEDFDPEKLHFMEGEYVLPDQEIEINNGVIYKGKKYDINMDIDQEREIADENVWDRDRNSDLG